MKIGYLMQQGVEIRTPPFNGPANHVRHVVQELEKLGHQVRVVLRLDDQIWKSDDLENFTPVMVNKIDKGPFRLLERVIRRIQYELKLPFIAFFDSFRFAVACRQELRGYNLLCERIGWPGYGGAIAARWLNIPLVLEDNGDQLHDLEAKGIAPKGMQRKISVGLMGRSVKQAAHIVSTGEGWRRQFIDRWQPVPEKVTTVENGTTLTEILPREQLQTFQNKNNKANPTIRLVYVGGFYPWHGIPVLLPAFSRALQAGTRAELLLIGTGDGMDEAKQLVKDLNIAQAVTFAGYLKPYEYAPILAKSAVGLSPYCGWKEFSGLKILDYKAAGLPTIASGQDGQPPTLKHEYTGLIVPPCDEDELCKAIIRLGNDSELRRRMGQTARLEAEQIHGWDHTAKELEKIFNALLPR